MMGETTTTHAHRLQGKWVKNLSLPLSIYLSRSFFLYSTLSYSLPLSISLSQVRISGLPDRADWRTVKDFLRDCADPAFVDNIFNGEGVAEFKSASDAQRVVDKLDDTKFQGGYINVRLEDSRGGGRGGGGRDRDDRGRGGDRRDSSRDRGDRRDRSRSRLELGLRIELGFRLGLE
jgi:hypothetical protein